MNLSKVPTFEDRSTYEWNPALVESTSTSQAPHLGKSARMQFEGHETRHLCAPVNAFVFKGCDDMHKAIWLESCGDDGR
jgi:hypothetical protein